MISVRKMEGIAKLVGGVIGFSGALVYAFVKGPVMKFMNWYPQNARNSFEGYSGSEWIKGSFVMLSANIAWSLWLVLQV